MKQGELETGRPALDLIEEAVHLLRRAGLGQLASYYIGSLPFVLGLLYFWADMSRSAFARWHCAEAALGLAALFLWMKVWQAVFVHGLKQRMHGDGECGWSALRVVRLIKFQASIQPLGLFCLPVALLATIPFGWGYAFFQNALVVGGEQGNVAQVYRKSLQQAFLWPAQNHVILAVVFLLGCFVFINLSVAMAFAPYLVKMLIGLDTVFTRTGIHIVNTTFLTTACGLTYLCIDPVIKTVYVLRCFYGESLATGEDLKVHLKSWMRPARLGAGLIVILLMGAAGLQAAEGGGGARDNADWVSPQPTRQSFMRPAELDRSIAEVLSRREYRWRLPRGSVEGQAGRFPSLIQRVFRWVRNVFKAVGRVLRRVLEWLKKLLPVGPAKNSSGGRYRGGWMKNARMLALLLLAGATLTVGFYLRGLRRRRARRTGVEKTTAVMVAPDLADERVAADRLPSSGWAVMAQSLMDQGEFRLALRAFYLAGLAFLAERDLIVIARYKSDHEYERDLRRRIHVKPDLLEAFAKNLALFEKAWYGSWKLTRRDLQAFAANFERMKFRA